MVDPPRFAFVATFFCAFLGLGLTPLAPADDNDAELERLRARIDRLQRALNQTAEKRDTAREELHAQERRINDARRSLREIDARLARDTRALAAFKRREQREREAQQAHLRALAVQLRAAHTLGRQPYLKMLFNQENPAAVARVLAYYRYFNAARVARVERAQAQLAQLERLAAETRRRTQTLSVLRERREREHQALDASRQRRAVLLAALDRRAAGQTHEIERLRADERRLERLVRGLKTVLPETSPPFPDRHARFGTLKGRLPLPVAGRPIARFGERKGIGDLTWRGLFLTGKEGQEVRAVARGRVAFADWLRGFGLLLILDHGDGYMTLYGHNEALYRRAGEWVDPGQPIAAVGSTGDAPGIGVYFEIRYQGVPHDPLQWCAIGPTARSSAD